MDSTSGFDHPDPDKPGPFGISSSWYTPEWATAKGLPVTCESCGLPFDRTGATIHTPTSLNSRLVADGLEPIANTHCPRFVGRDERWTCEGKATPMTRTGSDAGKAGRDLVDRLRAALREACGGWENQYARDPEGNPRSTIDRLWAIADIEEPVTRTISDDDTAALVAVRSVIADAAHHPGRAAAMKALDRLSANASPPTPTHHAAPRIGSSTTVAEILELYGFSALSISRRPTYLDYEIAASCMGVDRLLYVTDRDATGASMPIVLWQSAIRRLAQDLGLDDSPHRAERLVEILARVSL